ncbi:zinc ribbon-containing protein [Marinomonas pontica]|uniref:zinc ribbon-containing protein n=1 Tax=Marinomonas pontica TaxID=264739 RepID=UPI003B9874AB
MECCSLKAMCKERVMSTTGEKPGTGTYTCTSCGETVRLDDTSDRLPPCPRCHKTDYKP